MQEDTLIKKKPFSGTTQGSKQLNLSRKIPRKNGYFELNFIVEKCLGMGAFGKVYSAFEKSTNKKFAAKMIDCVIEEDESKNFMHNIINEAEINKTLNHPNIIKFYDVFLDENSIVIISELGECDLYQEIKSKAYSEKLRDKKLYSYAETLNILNCLCSALQYADLKKIYHGDIKPENVIKVDNVYKLTDWGSSVQCTTSLNQTQTVDIIALSMKFCAPELEKIVKGGNYKFHINPSKCDIYSLGVLMFKIYFLGVKSIKKAKIENFVRVCMEKNPKYYPIKFCELILAMTNENRKKRPNIMEIIKFVKEELEKNHKQIIDSAHSSDEDDLYGETHIVNYFQKIKIPEVEKARIRHNTFPLLTYNKFFDFSLDIDVIKTLKSYDKVIVVSVSGKSGIGKSFNI